VAREGEEVGVDGLHVDGSRRNRLCPVDEDVRADVVGQVRQFRDGVDGAEGVRDVHHGDHLGRVVDEVTRVVHVEVAVLVDADVSHFRAGLLRDLLPRHERRVVFHLGEHHRVARAEFGEAPRVGDEVHRLRGVLREDDFLSPVGPDELGDAVVGLLVRDRSLLAQVVDAPVDVRVVAAVVVADGLYHRLGRVTRRGVVQVDEGDGVVGPLPGRLQVAADLPAENRELLPDGLDVEGVRFLRFH
jgi:hypothetical protein